MRRKNNKRSQRPKRIRNEIMTNLSVTYTGNLPFWDYQVTVTPSTTCTTLLLLDPLLSSSGLLAQYPQSCNGYWNGSTFRLRTRIVIRRVEMRCWITGAQSNALLAGDLFNYLRIAFYLTGSAYTDSTEQYLGNGVVGGTDIDDISKVFYDKTFTLSSTMYNSTTAFNTPATRTICMAMDCGLAFDVYSTTATGTGGPWNTVRNKILCDLVSDSTVVPHPQVNVSFRFFYKARQR